MNWLQKITGQIKEKAYYYTSGAFIKTYPQYQLTRSDNVDSYRSAWIVNACITKIAEAVANIKLDLYQVNKREDVKQLFTHRLFDLLAMPNPTMSGFEFFKILITTRKLYGNTYILKLRNEGNKNIQQLWLLKPDCVTVRYNEGTNGLEYLYQFPGAPAELFPGEDIIHLKNYDPLDNTYGMPDTQPIMETIKTFVFSSRWNMNFFYNSARPDALIVTKAKMTGVEKEEFKKDWNQKMGGWEQSHKLGILSGEVQYNPVNFNMRDMQFSTLHDKNIEDILSAFGVPKPILARTDMQNRAVADAAIYAFMKFSVVPEIRSIMEKLNIELVSEFGSDLYLDFTDPTPEDREAEITEYQAGWNKWLTTNEIRDKENLPPLEGGWSIYLPLGVFDMQDGIPDPAGDAAPKMYKEIKLSKKKYYEQKEAMRQAELKRKILPKLHDFKKDQVLRSTIKRALLGMVEKKIKKVISIRTKKFSTQEKAELFIEHTKRLNKDETLFRRTVVALLNRQKNDVVEAVHSDRFGKSFTKTDWDPDRLINWDIQKLLFVEVSKPVFKTIITNRAKRAANIIGATFTPSKRIEDFIDKKAEKFAEQVNETTKERVRNALKAGIQAKEGSQEIAARVNDVFTTRSKSDSVRIAKTEVLSASNEAEFEVYKQNRFIGNKEWLHSGSGNPRPEHLAMNGEVVGKNDRFSNGLLYPGDMAGDASETINCGCSLLPNFD